VRQETSGRVRVQCFIETLLERIALAERLVQFYQEEYYRGDSPPTHTHTSQVNTHTLSFLNSTTMVQLKSVGDYQR